MRTFVKIATVLIGAAAICNLIYELSAVAYERHLARKYYPGTVHICPCDEK